MVLTLIFEMRMVRRRWTRRERGRMKVIERSCSSCRLLVSGCYLAPVFGQQTSSSCVLSIRCTGIGHLIAGDWSVPANRDASKTEAADAEKTAPAANEATGVVAEMAPQYVCQLLPQFVSAYQSTMLSSVRKSSLTIVRKIFHCCSSALLMELFDAGPDQQQPAPANGVIGDVAELLATVLNGEDDDSHQMALQIIQDLTAKCPHAFLDHLVRLGVFSRVQQLAEMEEDDRPAVSAAAAAAAKDEVRALGDSVMGRSLLLCKY